MTSTAPLPANTGLPAIDPQRATLQTELIHALNHRLADGLALSAGAAAAADAAGGWIELDAAGAALYVAPLLADGLLCRLTDATGRLDAALAAVALGAVEPLIAAIELTIGRELRPVGVVAAPAASDVVLRVEASDAGAAVHRLVLAMADDVAIAPAGTLPPDPASFIDVAPGWTARIAGPALATGRVGAIGPGDLVLLGTPTGLACFRPPGRAMVLAGRLDIRRGVIEVEQELALAEDLPPPRPGVVGPGDAATVPLSVTFDGGGLTLDRLAALGIGSVVPIPGIRGGALPVKLLAADRCVAAGDLVAVGDGYGVLVTAVTPPDASGD